MAKNQRGHIIRVCDQSGVRRNDEFDFKCNCISSTTQLAADYKSALDWTADVQLESEVYASTAVFDALYRPCVSTDSLGQTTRRQCNILGGVIQIDSVNRFHTGRTAHITNITYTADDKPALVDYDNSSRTNYTYYEQMRRIRNKKTWRDDDKVLEDITYTYNCLGRITHVDDAAHHSIFFRNRKVDPAKD